MPVIFTCGHALHLQSMSVILEKFKEKKPTVVAALRDASDAVYASGVSDFWESKYLCVCGGGGLCVCDSVYM